MPEKAPLYRIDEARLRTKLLGYEVPINEAQCASIEEEVAAIRFKKTLNLNLPKVNLRIAIPAAIGVILLIVLVANFNSIADLFSPAPETKKVESTSSRPVAQPSIKVNEPAATTVTTSSPAPTATISTPKFNPPPVQQAIVTKTDTEAKKPDTSTQDNAKKPNPVLAQPPSDSAAKAAVSNGTDTSVQPVQEPVKKKKRRRRNANMEELKESTLQPNSADDEIVVPQ